MTAAATAGPGEGAGDAGAGDPGRFDAGSFDAVAARAAAELGVILCTVLLISPDRTHTRRVRTTHPEVYPVGGSKRLDPSQTSPLWLDEVVRQQQVFVGSDAAAVREFFFDFAVIESLGCGSIINTPVVHEGATIGSVNFLAAEHRLGEEEVATALELTRILVPELAAQHAEMLEEES